MKRRLLGVLIALNVGLLVALAVVSFSTEPAEAQARRRGGDYMMVSGQFPGQRREAVYIFELNTSRMIVLGFNSSNDKLEIFDGRETMSDLPQGGYSR